MAGHALCLAQAALPVHTCPRGHLYFHYMCAGYTQGPGAQESGLYISLAKFGLMEKGKETQGLFACFIHFPGRVLFGDTLFFFVYEALFYT